MREMSLAVFIWLSSILWLVITKNEKNKMIVCYFDVHQNNANAAQKDAVFICCVRKQQYLCIVKTRQIGVSLR